MNVYGLIGNPLGHSFSKKYFTEKFEKEKRKDCNFELFPLTSISEFPGLIKRIKNLKGLAVTIPYKESVISFLNDLDETAENIGSVNCIKINENKLTGYNTDASGFKRSVMPLLLPGHTKALILGSGGSSKAVQYVLRQLNIDFLIVTRNKENAQGQINYDSINGSMISNYTLIINCTPVGMSPNEEKFPYIPYQFLTEKNILFDLVYNPVETLFLKMGKQYGAKTKNGFEMLLIQAEENWRIWNEGVY